MEWKSIFRCTAAALQYIHDCDFIHNDLKANNIVLEKFQDDIAAAYNPAIIYFACSIKTQDARLRTPKPNHLKVNKGSYIAPEILDGTGKPSFCSDVYSFARMVKLIHKQCNFQLFSSIKKAVSHSKTSSVNRVEGAVYLMPNDNPYVITHSCLTTINFADRLCIVFTRPRPKAGAES